MDLRNAFGEIDHGLIRATLQEYNVPATVIRLFENIYKDSRVVIAVNKDQTEPVVVKRDVLQGDPSSPLLFNVCFNSLMRTIMQPKYHQLGYLWGTNNTAWGRSWMQFADDAIIVASNDRNAQTLLDVFTAWCHWADMRIRIDKCHSFGMRKEHNVFQQYLPAVTSSGAQIPAVKIGDSFTYLGKLFNSSMSKEEAQK